jgi:hypothetical protein
VSICLSEHDLNPTDVGEANPTEVGEANVIETFYDDDELEEVHKIDEDTWISGESDSEGKLMNFDYCSK